MPKVFKAGDIVTWPGALNNPDGFVIVKPHVKDAYDKKWAFSAGDEFSLIGLNDGDAYGRSSDDMIHCVRIKGVIKKAKPTVAAESVETLPIPYGAKYFKSINNPEVSKVPCNAKHPTLNLFCTRPKMHTTVGHNKAHVAFNPDNPTAALPGGVWQDSEVVAEKPKPKYCAHKHLSPLGPEWACELLKGHDGWHEATSVLDSPHTKWDDEGNEPDENPF